MSASLRTIAPLDGSRTLVIAQPEHDRGEGASHDGSVPSGSIRLRGGPRSRQRVVWDDSVVDNEHMGKKKSKICCIYHKPKAFDESSDESSDSDSDASSSPSDDGRARPSQRPRHRRCSHDSHDCHNESSSPSPGDAQHSRDTADITVVHQHRHHHSDSNAYEVQPTIKGKGRANAV